MQDYNQAFAFVDALTGDGNNAIVDFRAVHDQNKAIPGIPFRDTIKNAWNSIVYYNSQGYGIFAVVNELDGAGREYHNVKSVRAHFVDLDNVSAMQNLQRAKDWTPAPSFAVQSSQGKAHVYWPVHPYLNNDYFALIQKKLIQFFDGDPRIFDAPRIMRLPGTLHCKAVPQLVHCYALSGYGNRYNASDLETALAHVNIAASFTGRKELGDKELAAPSIEWIKYALSNVDPNSLDRGEWISITAAIKQAGWSLTDEQTLFGIWSEWCGQYAENDQGENLKQWNSISDTQLGWQSIVRRVPAVGANWHLGQRQQAAATPQNWPASVHTAPGAGKVLPSGLPSPSSAATPPMPQPPAPGTGGEILTDRECSEWFKGCVYISQFGKILTSDLRMMGASAFNAQFGGKKFIVDSVGKITNEAWQAATRSTLWTVPKADHIRFLPHMETHAIIKDELGRKGVNIYKPAIIETMEGDPSPFLNHLELLIPDINDRKILLDFFAHNVKFPGHKIPWAPLIQSNEGAGKGVFKEIIEHAIGKHYTHFPNARELAESGSKFNAWMRGKLFILVDEIKVDDRQDLVETLKPMISEKEIEIQGKGYDQEKEDNFANWAFFSNYKNAIPVNKNGRRYAIFYSELQTVEDLEARGMGKEYFDRIYSWLGKMTDQKGLKIVTNYLMNYPVERGSLPMRAPDTSSKNEALRHSRSPVERMIMEAIEDNLPGFRGGYISSLAAMNRAKVKGLRVNTINYIETVLESMGYHNIGRATRSYFTEDAIERTQLFHIDRNADISTFGIWQGYE